MSRRIDKLNQAILESVSQTVHFAIRDPRVKNVTVTRVETAGDTRTAKVYVSVMGDESEQRLCLHGLESARGFIQKKVADRIETRFTPVLDFILDEGIKKSIEASRLIRGALADGIELPGDRLSDEELATRWARPSTDGDVETDAATSELPDEAVAGEIAPNADAVDGADSPNDRTNIE